jgi:hypothetical protein
VCLTHHYAAVFLKSNIETGCLLYCAATDCANSGWAGDSVLI